MAGRRSVRTLGTKPRLGGFGRQDSFRRPASVEAVGDCAARDAGDLAPHVSGFGAAFEGDETSSGSVPLLFETGGPLAVARFVSSVVVDSLDAHLGGWSCPHVGEEVGKRAAPPIADGDSSTTVPFEVRMLGVRASANDAFPDGVFGREVHAVRSNRSGTPFGPQAATTERRVLLVPQARRSDHLDLPALASALPSGCRRLSGCGGVVARRGGPLDYRQSSELLTRDVNERPVGHRACLKSFVTES